VPLPPIASDLLFVVTLRVGHRSGKSTALAGHERDFWARMATVLPDQHYVAWQQLEKELQVRGWTRMKT
jgi:hypothetical protein